MKRLIFAFLLSIIFITGCEKENSHLDKIIGKWQLVKGYDIMWGFYSVDTKDQRIEKYTRDNVRIRYDYLGNEIGRCNFWATESTITIYGEKLDGSKWELSYEYWFSNDTLKIRNDGGFEFYDEFFIRIK
jgi:hypothetical protein